MTSSKIARHIVKRFVVDRAILLLPTRPEHERIEEHQKQVNILVDQIAAALVEAREESDRTLSAYIRQYPKRLEAARADERRRVGEELMEWFTQNHNQSDAGYPYLPLAIARDNIRRICGMEGEDE